MIDADDCVAAYTAGEISGAWGQLARRTMARKKKSARQLRGAACASGQRDLRDGPLLRPTTGCSQGCMRAWCPAQAARACAALEWSILGLSLVGVSWPVGRVQGPSAHAINTHTRRGFTAQEGYQPKSAVARIVDWSSVITPVLTLYYYALEFYSFYQTCAAW